MKFSLPVLALLFFALASNAQRMKEGLNTSWPPEYQWKIVRQSNTKGVRELVIIPGSETINTASIIGVMTANEGLTVSTVDSVILFYKTNLDEGSVLTVLEQSHDPAKLWVLFKVETPKTPKYPDPESDLYYAAQGEYALYDAHVAVKLSSLPADFLSKWVPILKSSELKKNK